MSGAVAQITPAESVEKGALKLPFRRFQVVTGRDALIGMWISFMTHQEYTQARGPCIGLIDVVGNRIVGGVMYEDWNGASIVCHIALTAPMTRDFLAAIFNYPFIQLGCRKIIAGVPESNQRSRKFVLHLGFSLEATLKDACPDGNLLIYTMAKPDCRWLKLKSPYNVQTQSAQVS